MTTCPSGVHYMHLVDHARVHIEKTYRRPLFDWLLRRFLARVLPDPKLFRLALYAGWLVRPFAGLLAALGLQPLAAMLRLAPATRPPVLAPEGRQVHAALGPRKGRVLLLTGCANDLLRPAINAATIRLLTRHGIEVVVAAGQGCCGSLRPMLTPGYPRPGRGSMRS
jgi:glycolate oxidase iron-sulfur subunit